MNSDQRTQFDADGLNSGTWPVAIPTHFITPVDRFFIRSHGPAPAIDAASYRVYVDGLVDRPVSFSLDELRELPQRTIAATLVCAGLRRSEFLSLGPLPGELPWGQEPVSTGEWSGVFLRDVLQGLAIHPSARSVEFTGQDQVEREGRRFGFGASIDLAKALTGEVLLATALNERPLSVAHGFPLRAVVPGWIGAKSVKWLDRITLLAQPSDNYFQSKAYRNQRSPDPDRPRDVSAGEALHEVPLNAVIVEPREGATVAVGPLVVRGWAMAPASRPLASVDVSADGHDWQPARLVATGSEWTWSFWETTLYLPSGVHRLAVRATDVTGATQPAELRETWNVKGYANNAWHRVVVTAR